MEMTFLEAVSAVALMLGAGNCYNLDTFHPIIYRSPEDTENSYFGTSVVIRPRAATLNDSWAIQIGAPREQVVGERTLRPGTAYRCNFRGPCRRLRLDEAMGTVGGRGVHEYKQKKDDAWIGVSMDVVDSGLFERSIVCGHRWMNEDLKNSENIDVTYLMTGICYLQDIINGSFGTPVRRLLPLVNKDKIYTPKPYVVNLSTYHWGLGQAGVSLKLTRDASEVLIGAPGVTHWIGSVIRYDVHLHAVVGHFAGTKIARENRYTYLGYAVAVGRFYRDRELWYVAGAPRSANYHGQVFTFQYKGTSEDIRLQSNLEGATFGEYFGASLATADLNADSFDDLIVGAPLYSGTAPDGGRIYVYLGTGRGNFLVPSQTVSGHASDGRFGSCVSSAKDLDGDGYADVVVGAPFEEGGGAVYVYRGSDRGLRTQYSQRISGQDVHSQVRGFGASISGAVDVDGNKYEDVAVGSYLSGHVVLLRSRPVIALHPDIELQNGSLIGRKDFHVNVSLCSKFVGSEPPEYVDIVRLLDIDPVHGRATINPRTSSYRKSIRLQRNGLSEKNYSPLQITVRNELGPCMSVSRSVVMVQGEQTRGRDSFSQFCPVGATAERTKEIPFAGTCGTDLTCHSDLKISCSFAKFPGGPYILGAGDPIVLSVKVSNLEEPAYGNQIKIWSDLKLRLHTHGNAANPPRQNFWIDLEDLLTESFSTEFPFQIDLDSLNEVGQRSRLNLIVEIFTSSSELNHNNNKCRLSLELTTQAHLDFYASSSLVSAYASEKSLQQTLHVTHYYEVQKTGVTPFRNAEMTIYIPVYRSAEFLSFETEASEWMQLSYASEVALPKSDEISLEVSNNGPPPERTVFFNCSSPDCSCKVFKVFFLEGIPAGLSSYVKIILSLNISAVDMDKMKEDIIHVSTAGVLRWWELVDGEARELRRSAAISVYEKDRTGRVDGRVVGLSVLAGGVLLCFIVTGLMRRNFFKRAKRQELQALRDAEESFVYFVATRGEQVSREEGAE